MRNVIGKPVVGDDLYGREYELSRIWELIEQGEHILMLAPRRVGKTSLMLELHRAPRDDWDVLYVDVEKGDSSADCVASIIATLAADPRFRSRIEAILFSTVVKDILSRVSIGVDIDVLRVELKNAMGRDWDLAADRLQARLAGLPDAGHKLLIVIDELPILVSRMLRAGGQRDAELLLSRFRHWRQSPELRDRVQTLFGGSIGLEGVLRRAGISGSINDLAPFHLDSWDRSTAADFLVELGRNRNFELDSRAIFQILNLLQDPVPFHVQLFFFAVRDVCKRDPSRVSPELIDRCFAERLAGASGTAHLDHYVTRLEVALGEREYELVHQVLSQACRGRDGTTIEGFTDLIQQDERTFRAVLRDLEADGYLIREADQLAFRSNLLREWWRRHHARRTGP